MNNLKNKKRAGHVGPLKAQWPSSPTGQHVILGYEEASRRCQEKPWVRIKSKPTPCDTSQIRTDWD